MIRRASWADVGSRGWATASLDRRSSVRTDHHVNAPDIIEMVLAAARPMSRPAFRGQANADWQLRSGAVHRIAEAHGDSVLDDDSYLRQLVGVYHREISAAMETIDGDHMMSSLQRLSILQHWGAATGFLDFTESALVALWFACDGLPDRDGRVFILDIGNPQVAVDGRGLSEEALFSTERTVYYEPDRTLGPRIIAQQSVFVICDLPPIPDPHVSTVVVPKESKERLREHLGDVGVSERVLFGDVPGLARAHARSNPILLKSTLTPEQHRDRGTRAYQAQRYEDALTHYESYAAAVPEVAQPHCLVGDTLSALGRFEDAVDAYTRAIERIARPIDIGQGAIIHGEAVGRYMLHTLYYNRGNAHAAAGSHAEAIADFDSALEHGSQLKRNVLLNRGNSKYVLEHFAEAFGDFDAVWSERQGSDAALALGNCKVMAGEFLEALKRYLDGTRLGQPEGSAVHCRNNAERCHELLDALEGQQHVVRRQGHVVFVEATSGAAKFPFAGNKGNVGNTPSGMVNAPGGEGYEGGSGFAVVILQTPS